MEPQAGLTPPERTVLLGLFLLYSAAVVVLRIGHGGDIVPEIQMSQRWLTGSPLYGAELPAAGMWWPPFAAVALVPLALLARLSLAVATGAWSVFSVLCIAAVAVLARRWGWRPVILALLATAVPLQTNFEHRNINTVLLALALAGIVDLEDGRDTRAGIWLGLAAALKAFPALLVAYLAARGRWRAFGSAALVASAATLLALLPYGLAGGASTIKDWLTLSLSEPRWTLGPNDQSVRAVVARLGGPPLAWALVGLACLAVVALALRRPAATREPLEGIGLVLLVAILITPIAWVHYFVLAAPAWLAVLTAPDVRDRARWRRVGLWLAGLATSGWLTVGPGVLRAALLEHGIYTWGGLVLLALLVWQRLRPIPNEPGMV